MNQLDDRPTLLDMAKLIIQWKCPIQIVGVIPPQLIINDADEGKVYFMDIQLKWHREN